MSEIKSIYEIAVHSDAAKNENFNQDFDPVEIIRLQTEREIAYWKKVNSDKPKHEYVKQILSMDELKNIILKRGYQYLNADRVIETDADVKHFVIDSENETVIEMLIYYFLNDKTFEIYNKSFSLNKSIQLRSSSPGTGKTLLLKLFSWNPLWEDTIRFAAYQINKIINCRKIISEYRSKGDEIYNAFCERNFEKIQLNTWVFDELGREDKSALYYGNRTNVMEKILAARYDLFADHGIKTHITTNIVNGDDIESSYGNYLRSRMREMCNVITLPGNDRRN